MIQNEWKACSRSSTRPRSAAQPSALQPTTMLSATPTLEEWTPARVRASGSWTPGVGRLWKKRGVSHVGSNADSAATSAGPTRPLHRRLHGRGEQARRHDRHDAAERRSAKRHLQHHRREVREVAQGLQHAALGPRRFASFATKFSNDHNTQATAWYASSHGDGADPGDLAPRGRPRPARVGALPGVAANPKYTTALPQRVDGRARQHVDGDSNGLERPRNNAAPAPSLLQMAAGARGI